VGTERVDEHPFLLHPTADDRAKLGRAARTEVPRSSHSVPRTALRRDPIALLEAQNESRVAELVPIRYGRMLASPLAFFRGSAAVMAHDLASLPNSGLHAQLSGDAHLLNFGGFASPERGMVFDLNDFDETLAGPFEWDVKRLAASFEIAARARNFRKSERLNAVLGVVRAYREAVREFAAIGDLDVWYARLDVGSIVKELKAEHDQKLAKTVTRSVAKARANDGMRALSTLTRQVDGSPLFVSEPPLIVPLAELATENAEAPLRAIYRSYRHSLPADRRLLLERFRYIDSARKVVGVGSVGTRCWVLLMLGRDEHDPLFLQMKEAEASVLEPLLGASGLASHGQRIVEGQRLMQAASDIFLGWVHDGQDVDGSSRDFYVRQLRDWKLSVDLETILPGGLGYYGVACGWTLARAHARTGDRIAIAAYLGAGDTFDRAVAEFAAGYADVNEQDHRALGQAVAAGKVTALEGV
jgi:uncharacterized protein (DUF2252 family)